MFDCIVVGNGPAGISCAIYLKRFGFNVLVIGMDEGTLKINTTIENYYGIGSIKSVDLINNGILQAKSLGIDVLKEEVINIELGSEFKVITNIGKYCAKTIFLGTGKVRKKLNIKGLKEFEGKGVSYCAVCDGFIYRKKRIALIGSGDYMKAELDVLKRFTKDLFVFTNGLDTDITDIEVIKDEIVEFTGDGVLKSIITNNNSYEVDAAFIAVGSQDTLSLAKHLGLIVDEKGDLIVTNSHTNISGIFAGGDCTQGVKQIVKAAADGCIAAYEIKEYLRGK
jgi:thioredoxin reductase (NADPH)